METLLSISIPTFNRANLLNQQLSWLRRAIRGFEAQCEILVADNCSTDDTPKVVEKWQSEFKDVRFQFNRHSENIGAVRNIAYCIKAANGKYVWTISDDDLIYDEAIAYVLKNLSHSPNLSLLLLNYSSHFVKTGKVRFNRCFSMEGNGFSSNGKALFEHCLEKRGGSGLSLTTALIYRTKLAKQALQDWKLGLDNAFVQLYWTYYCAVRGGFKVSQENYLECTAGEHHFTKKPEVFVKSMYADLPAIYVKLMAEGCNPRICKGLVLKSFKKIQWPLVLKALLRHPLFVLNSLLRYLGSIRRTQPVSFVGAFIVHKIRAKFDPRRIENSNA